MIRCRCIAAAVAVAVALWAALAALGAEGKPSPTVLSGADPVTLKCRLPGGEVQQKEVTLETGGTVKVEIKWNSCPRSR